MDLEYIEGFIFYICLYLFVNDSNLFELSQEVIDRNIKQSKSNVHTL